MQPTLTSRVDWVDIAKGLCIIFVVMMHATEGVAARIGDAGFMTLIVDFARPFRMPDFFLISGLFLGLVIDRSWRRYFDRKVVHFAYFYVLWLTIQFAFKAPGMAMEQGAGHALTSYLMAFVQPFGTLWFIYALPVFFIFTRLVKTLPVWLVFAWAALLEIMPVHTGWVLFDEFCARYVYFFAGYAFAQNIFAIAAWCRQNMVTALALLGVWGVVNGALVFTPAAALIDVPLVAEQLAGRGLAGLPVISLALGLAGAGAIIITSTLLASVKWSWPLNWLGARSIVVYLAFFLPMAVTRAVLLKTGIITDGGVIALLVTIAAVLGPVVLYLAVQWSGYGHFLFKRPAWALFERRAKDRDPARVPAQ